MVPTIFLLKEDCAIRGEKRRGLEMITRPGSINLLFHLSESNPPFFYMRCLLIRMGSNNKNAWFIQWYIMDSAL